MRVIGHTDAPRDFKGRDACWGWITWTGHVTCVTDCVTLVPSDRIWASWSIRQNVTLDSSVVAHSHPSSCLLYTHMSEDPLAIAKYATVIVSTSHNSSHTGRRRPSSRASKISLKIVIHGTRRSNFNAKSECGCLVINNQS